MAKLNVVDGPDLGTEYDLDENNTPTPLTVGRDPRVEIALNDPAVSREHFRIESTTRGWRLVDLGSRNQTFLNGEQVRESLLANGDVLRAGDTELRFEDFHAMTFDDAPGSTIVKTLPTTASRETFLGRLDKLERMLQEEKARRTLGEVRKLFEVQSRLSISSSPTELFRQLLSEVVPALAADRAAVIVRQGKAWEVHASHPAGEFDNTSFSQSIVDQVAKAQKALLIEDSESGEHEVGQGSLIDKGISTVLAIPLVVSDQVPAVVYADRRGKATPFLEADLTLLTAAIESIGPLAERLLEEARLRNENQNLFRSLTDTKKIIGKSAAVQKVLEFIGRAAPTSMTVLIGGETGTGKELVASAIHYASDRRGKPFIALNCAALPENLLESELFGHEKGAFTSAQNRRKGRFELAHNGTIFLDEIGELSPACQGKLLRLLEEQSFERVGGSESIQVDVRVVAATNCDLLHEVEERKFREDLYYRLSVLTVSVPPLRERQDDIPLLASHFLSQCRVGAKKLSKKTEQKLRSYPWPGNIRQLRNVVESAVDDALLDDVLQ